MNLAHILLILLFGIMGYYDNKNRDIPNIFTALSILVVVFFFPEYSLWALAGFGSFYFMNTLSVMLTKEPFIGWADVLALPGYIAAFADMAKTVPLLYFLGVAGLVIPFIDSGLNHSKSPIVYYMGWAYAFALIFYAFYV